MVKPKHNYDSKKFYNKLLDLAVTGLTDKEIAMNLNLSREAFTSMKNGNYSKWTEEENKTRSERIVNVLAQGRDKLNSVVRGAYLKAALGGKILKSTTVTKRKLKIEGVYTNDEEIMTQTTEQEMPYNVQALATWLHHHDPEWRKAEMVNNEDIESFNVNIHRGVDIENWIKKEIENQ